jgi:PncC family amidohydrolase
MSIFKKVSKKLIKYNKKISFAESCTGGLLAYSLIKNPNVSPIINQSFITYSNKVKRDLLKVKKKTLLKKGAVSKKCVKEMAKGLFKITKSDICVSISGIAGPNGGSKNKPIGSVYFCILYHTKYYTFKLNLKGCRKKIQKDSAKQVFKKINYILMGV